VLFNFNFEVALSAKVLNGWVFFPVGALFLVLVAGSYQFLEVQVLYTARLSSRKFSSCAFSGCGQDSRSLTR